MPNRRVLCHSELDITEINAPRGAHTIDVRHTEKRPTLGQAHLVFANAKC